MYKLAQEMLNDIKSQYLNDNRTTYYLSFKEMDMSVEKETYTNACEYLENKNLIDIYAKALGFWGFKLTSHAVDVFEDERRKRNMNIYDFSEFMNNATILRNNRTYENLKVLHEKEDECILFPPDIEPLPLINDKIILNGKTYVVTDVEEERPFNNELYSYRASYKQNHQPIKSGDTFNIHGNISGSIIGSQENATITNISEATSQLKDVINREVSDINDKELLGKMTTYIEMLIENNQPVQKGSLSKFSDILVKYAPVLSATGTLVIQWLKAKP